MTTPRFYNGRVAEHGSDSIQALPPGADPAGPGAVLRDPGTTSRAELLAALSLAIDLGLGQPMEHMLRATLLGLRMAELLGIGQGARGRIYYANLIAWIGCHADSHELADLFGDDIAFRADYYFIDAHGLPMLSLMLRHTGTALPLVQRTARRFQFAATAAIAMRTLIRSHCTSAGRLADRVGLDAGMPAILRHTFERWDGKGLPAGISGARIPLEMRIAQLADTAEVFLRTAGVTAAVGIATERRGTQFDPVLADLFCARAAELTDGLLELDPWPAALAAGPAGHGPGRGCCAVACGGAGGQVGGGRRRKCPAGCRAQGGTTADPACRLDGKGGGGAQAAVPGDGQQGHCGGAGHRAQDGAQPCGAHL